VKSEPPKQNRPRSETLPGVTRDVVPTANGPLASDVEARKLLETMPPPGRTSPFEKIEVAKPVELPVEAPKPPMEESPPPEPIAAAPLEPVEAPRELPRDAPMEEPLDE